jgi:hypothetical protein
VAEIPLEVVIHFPEKTHRIKGYLMQLDLNSDRDPVRTMDGWAKALPGRTGFTLQGIIADWKDKDGRKAPASVDLVEARRSATRAKRIARRERERTRRRAATQVHGDRA